MLKCLLVMNFKPPISCSKSQTFKTLDLRELFGLKKSVPKDTMRLTV